MDGIFPAEWNAKISWGFKEGLVSIAGDWLEVETFRNINILMQRSVLTNQNKMKRRKSYFHQRPGLIPCWIHKPWKKPTRRPRHLRKPSGPGEIIVMRHFSVFKESLSRGKKVLNWATICALETISTL